jgi:hypothetical protein
VRLLKILTFPISWPLGKLLDVVLGHRSALLGRRQLKALVDLHHKDAGGQAGCCCWPCAIPHRASSCNSLHPPP